MASCAVRGSCSTQAGRPIGKNLAAGHLVKFGPVRIQFWAKAIFGHERSLPCTRECSAESRFIHMNLYPQQIGLHPFRQCAQDLAVQLADRVVADTQVGQNNRKETKFTDARKSYG